MAITTGKSGNIHVGANPIACIETFTIDESVPISSVACMGDDNMKKSPGVGDWKGSMALVTDPADTTGQGALVKGATLAATFFPVDELSGSPEWTGNVIIASIGTAVSSTEFGKTTVNFEGDGDLTKGVVV